MKMLEPDITLLVKIGSVVVHAQELIEDGGHEFDVQAIKSLLSDKDLQLWIAEMTKAALLPVRRK